MSRRNRAAAVHPLTLDWGAAFAERFSPLEAKAIWERFRPLDQGLQAKAELAPPPYEDRPSRYYFYRLPANLDVAGLIDGWCGNGHGL